MTQYLKKQKRKSKQENYKFKIKQFIHELAFLLLLFQLTCQHSVLIWHVSADSCKLLFESLILTCWQRLLMSLDCFQNVCVTDSYESFLLFALELYTSKHGIHIASTHYLSVDVGTTVLADGLLIMSWIIRTEPVRTVIKEKMCRFGVLWYTLQVHFPAKSMFST